MTQKLELVLDEVVRGWRGVEGFGEVFYEGTKCTKKEPGWFYGFSKDIWQAYAVGVTYFDMYIEPNLKKEGIK